MALSKPIRYKIQSNLRVLIKIIMNKMSAKLLGICYVLQLRSVKASFGSVNLGVTLKKSNLFLNTFWFENVINHLDLYWGSIGAVSIRWSQTKGWRPQMKFSLTMVVCQLLHIWSWIIVVQFHISLFINCNCEYIFKHLIIFS